MAQPLQTINLIAPGFKGINTEDSPLAQDPSFAELADNAVIDRRGRVAARKGNDVVTTDKTELGTDRIHRIHRFYDDAGNEKLFSTGNNKILSGTDTLVDETPVAYSILANDWKMFNFNNSCYFFQEGYEPLVYNNTLGVVTPMTGVVGSSVTPSQYCGEAVGAFGRLWCVGSTTDKSTVYWSDLLDGTDFTGGSSGSINVEKAWPKGFDEVQALAAHNNFLIIFGKTSILVYQGANSPATMSLVDTVVGVGCVDKNSVQSIGTDVLFLDSSGLRSFGRVMQQKSLPITELSRNVKQDLITLIQNKTEPVNSVYSPENYFYLLCFPDQQTIYCFDLRGNLENGSYRITRWPSSSFTAFERDVSDGTLYIGSVDGLGTYNEYSDNGSSYRFKYFTPGLTFGDSSKTKFLKKIKPTLVGANSATVFLKWAYDFNTFFRSQDYIVGNQQPAFFGESEFNIGEFTGGQLTSRRSINATGSGTVVTIGLESDINGFPLSIQEINLLALIGKLL